MATAPVGKHRNLGSETVTEGIRIAVQPRYVPEQSDPDAGQWFFAYRIEIRNLGETTSTLRTRHWIITDADGERRDVEGEGVIGEQPRLEPGQSFVYESFCPLATPWGTMEGAYTFEREDTTTFQAGIDRFFLVSDPQPVVDA